MSTTDFSSDDQATEHYTTPDGESLDSEGQSGSDIDVIFKNTMYIGIGAVGICSNGFVIFVIANTAAMRRKYANWFVINQSVIDFCASIFLILDTTSFLFVKRFEGLAGELTCRLWSSAFLLWGTFISSTYNLVVISLERYLGVCHPIWHHKHFSRRAAGGFLVAPWLIGFVIEMFIPLVTSVENGTCVLYQFPTQFAQKAHGIFIIIVDYIFPFGFMVFCYISMALRAKNLSTASSKLKKQSEMNVLKTLVIVCSCYALCHFVSQMTYLRFNLGYTIDFHAWYYYLGVTGVNINCCINPFIYASKYDAFRKGIRSMFRASQSVGPGSTNVTLSQQVSRTTNSGAPVAQLPLPVASST